MNFDAMEKHLKSGAFKKARRTKAHWMFEYVFATETTLTQPVEENILLNAKLKSGYLLPYNPTQEDRYADDWVAVY